MAIIVFLLCLFLALAAIQGAMIPNILVIGEPGSGKTQGAARDAVSFKGSLVCQDPHKDSLGQLLLMHLTGNVLYDRIDDLDHSLGYGLLKPSRHKDLRKRAQHNLKTATFFVAIMMRRRGGDVASTPLLEEWVTALLLLYLCQAVTLPVEYVPYGFLPGTPEFAALLRGCTIPEIREKFRQLAGLTLRALRSEVGSASRLVNAVFRSPEFLLRCRESLDVACFIQNGGRLIVEKGDADEDVTRTIMCGINMLVTEHCESRPKPWPPVRIYLDECTNARTAGRFEEKKAGETRKYGLSWVPMCQHPNFEGGSEGYFQNCQEKHFYRCGDYTLARKLAAFVVGGMARGDDSRASLIDAVASELMTFKPGWRYVVGPGGTRKEYVPMLENLWPDWPGLREAKLREKLCQIHARLEYGVLNMPSASTGTSDLPIPPTNSASDSTAGQRWKQDEKKPADGLSDDANED